MEGTEIAEAATKHNGGRGITSRRTDRTAASSSAGWAEVSGQRDVREVGQHWHVTGPWTSKGWQVTGAVEFWGTADRPALHGTQKLSRMIRQTRASLSWSDLFHLITVAIVPPDHTQRHTRTDTHTHTPQSVDLLWTSDQQVAATRLLFRRTVKYCTGVLISP